MKAMSSIRIPVVVPLVVMAIKTAVKDNSPYVRKVT
jgi:vesicle coat complex subunit